VGENSATNLSSMLGVNLYLNIFVVLSPSLSSYDLKTRCSDRIMILSSDYSVHLASVSCLPLA